MNLSKSWIVAGLLSACGPEPATSSAEGTATGSTGTAGSTASTATPTTGGPEPWCVDPQPIFMRGSDIPSGFERCANGMIHRVEAVACAVEGTGSCMSGGNECLNNADCDEAPYGTCHQFSFLGCKCQYGCGSDADCATGEICACSGVLGPASQCIPAGCVDDGDCSDGLCGLAAGGSAECGTKEVAATACIDPTSACLVHADCPGPPQEPECAACWPDGRSWACGELPGCGVAC
jgi:hypothetical protein